MQAINVNQIVRITNVVIKVKAVENVLTNEDDRLRNEAADGDAVLTAIGISNVARMRNGICGVQGRTAPCIKKEANEGVVYEAIRLTMVDEVLASVNSLPSVVLLYKMVPVAQGIVYAGLLQNGSIKVEGEGENCQEASVDAEEEKASLEV